MKTSGNVPLMRASELLPKLFVVLEEDIRRLLNEGADPERLQRSVISTLNAAVATAYKSYGRSPEAQDTVFFVTYNACTPGENNWPVLRVPDISKRKN